MDDEAWEQARRFAQQNPELVEKTRAAGLQQLWTLGRWKALDAVLWDALGECLVVRFRAGRPDGRETPVDWEIPRELAAALLLLLGQAFEERDSAAPTRQ